MMVFVDFGSWTIGVSGGAFLIGMRRKSTSVLLVLASGLIVTCLVFFTMSCMLSVSRMEIRSLIYTYNVSNRQILETCISTHHRSDVLSTTQH